MGSLSIFVRTCTCLDDVDKLAAQTTPPLQLLKHLVQEKLSEAAKCQQCIDMREGEREGGTIFEVRSKCSTARTLYAKLSR